MEITTIIGTESNGEIYMTGLIFLFLPLRTCYRFLRWTTPDTCTTQTPECSVVNSINLCHSADFGVAVYQKWTSEKEDIHISCRDRLEHHEVWSDVLYQGSTFCCSSGASWRSKWDSLDFNNVGFMQEWVFLIIFERINTFFKTSDATFIQCRNNK